METCFSSNVAGGSPALEIYMQTRLKLAEKITSKPDGDCLCYITPESDVMTFKTINETHMHNAIKNLKNGKAVWPAKVPTTIIKDVVDLITKRLTMIFNLSLMNGVFPDI